MKEAHYYYLLLYLFYNVYVVAVLLVYVYGIVARTLPAFFSFPFQTAVCASKFP